MAAVKTVGEVTKYDGTQLGVKIEYKDPEDGEDTYGWYYTHQYQKATGQDTPIVGTKVEITPGSGCFEKGTVLGLVDPDVAEVYKLDSDGDPHVRFPDGNEDYFLGDYWQDALGVAPAVGQKVRCGRGGGCGWGLDIKELVS